MRTPTRTDISTEAALVRLLELDETDDPAKGRAFVQVLDDLPEPVRSWAYKSVGQIRSRLVGQGYASDLGGGSVAGGDETLLLTHAGVMRAEEVRALAIGSERRSITRDRMLAHIADLVEHSGNRMVNPRCITDTPWGWIGAQALSDKEVGRACDDLCEAGLLRAKQRLFDGSAHIVSLTHQGRQVLEAFDGSCRKWELSQHQRNNVTNISMSNSPGSNIAGTVHGDNTQMATTVTAPVPEPDLVELCREIRDRTPSLPLDDDEKEEVAQEVDRVTEAADAPEAKLEKLKRWLGKLRDLLVSAGKTAMDLVTKVTNALQWVSGKLEKLG